MIVGIVNFKMGNINSVSNALNYLGCENKIINTVEDFENITHIILPGVGSFNDAMINLNKLNFVSKIKEKVFEEKKKNFRYLSWNAVTWHIFDRKWFYKRIITH